EQILDAFRVSVVGVEGFEADDVIGTLATAASARGLQVVIVSGDKDFYQLIAPGIALLNPGRGGPAAVEEHWVDQANAGERLGVPLPLDLEAQRVRPPDVARLTELFTELEFRSLIPKLEGLQEVGAGTPDTSATAGARWAAGAEVSGVPALASAEPTIVDDPALLATVVAECRRASLVALDTETTSLDPLRADLVGMSLAVAPGRSWYLPFAHVAPDGELAGGTAPQNLPPLTSAGLAPLRELLSNPRVHKAGHN